MIVTETRHHLADCWMRDYDIITQNPPLCAAVPHNFIILSAWDSSSCSVVFSLHCFGIDRTPTLVSMTPGIAISVVRCKRNMHCADGQSICLCTSGIYLFGYLAHIFFCAW